jgi:formamidopyrimidine-DNA glycosylase
VENKCFCYEKFYGEKIPDNCNIKCLNELCKNWRDNVNRLVVLTIPELPEVETVVRDLREAEGCKVIFNKVFEHINSIRKTDIYDLKGLILEKIERYGKYIIFKFEKSSFLIHLGMAGTIFLDEGTALMPEHCHWLIQLDNGKQIRYIDPRRFGNLWHMPYEECKQYLSFRLGPEPWDLNVSSFILRIKQRIYLDKPIKVVLLDQHLIAGIGNIYASEICHEAFINPWSVVRNLTDKQLENILYCARRVLDKAIQNKGTSFMTFRNAKNQKGTNQNFLKVYKKKHCSRCNSDIKAFKIENRMTYWCSCQRLIGDPPYALKTIE